jgi:hypothetical protein
MIAPELKRPENLRRIAEDIVSPLGYVTIKKGALGYLIGRCSPDKPAEAFFISLCEMYEFNVTDYPGELFCKV